MHVCLLCMRPCLALELVTHITLTTYTAVVTDSWLTSSPLLMLAPSYFPFDHSSG